MVTVEMGKATFDSALIPVSGFTGEVVEKPLIIASLNRELKVTCVSVGNPDVYKRQVTRLITSLSFCPPLMA